MATLGQPGRYTFCLPEHPDSPPGWPSLATRRGLDPAMTAVTVLAVGGTAEAVPSDGGATNADVLDPIAALLAGAALAAGDPSRMAAAEQYVVLPPEVVDRLTILGLTVDSVAAELHARGNAILTRAGVDGQSVAAGPRSVIPIVSGGAGVKMLHLPGWMGGSRAVTVPISREPAPG